MEAWELTEGELFQLDTEKLAKYLFAKRCMGNEIAGGYDGWWKGREILIEIGWREVKREEGCRGFITLHKPLRFGFQPPS